MKFTPQQIAWLKTGEKAVGSAIATVAVDALIHGGLPTTKAGWYKLGGAVVSVVYTTIRLYISSTPFPGQTASPAEGEEKAKV